MIRHNSQKYIKRTVLDIELIDSENGLSVVDLRQGFYNIDDSRDKSVKQVRQSVHILTQGI